MLANIMLNCTDIPGISYPPGQHPTHPDKYTRARTDSQWEALFLFVAQSAPVDLTRLMITSQETLSGYQAYRL